MILQHITHTPVKQCTHLKLSLPLTSGGAEGLCPIEVPSPDDLRPLFPDSQLNMASDLTGQLLVRSEASYVASPSLLVLISTLEEKLVRPYRTREAVRI